MANTAFPDFDYALPTLEGFIDTSWKNDVCPSLTREADDANQTLILWCDYANEAKRDYEGGKRFTLVKGAYGDADNQTTLCASDDLADIRLALKIDAATQDEVRESMVRFTVGVLRRASDWQEGQDALSNHVVFGPWFRNVYGDMEDGITSDMQAVIHDAEERLGDDLPY